MSGAFSNRLTPAETERLAILAEELAEAGQAIGKILRHGYDSYHPHEGGADNRESLERELGDVLAAMRMLEMAGDVRRHLIGDHQTRKLERIGQWVHHQTSIPYILPHTRNYFSATGTLLNADGTRSIFDDVDK